MAGQDRGMGRTTEDGSLPGGRAGAYWYGPAQTEEEKKEETEQTIKNSQGEDWRPGDEEPVEIEGLIKASNKIIAEDGENSSKEEISFVLHGLINVLNGEDSGGFGTKKEEVDTLTKLMDIFKNIS
jgi:hypothetical protein